MQDTVQANANLQQFKQSMWHHLVGLSDMVSTAQCIDMSSLAVCPTTRLWEHTVKVAADHMHSFLSTVLALLQLGQDLHTNFAAACRSACTGILTVLYAIHYNDKHGCLHFILCCSCSSHSRLLCLKLAKCLSILSRLHNRLSSWQKWQHVSN